MGREWKPNQDAKVRSNRPRYPSGQPRREDPRATVLLRRIRQFARHEPAIIEKGKRVALDPRLGSFLGRMAIQKKLTNAEAAAGWVYARIVADFHWATDAKPLNPRSQAYERAFRAKKNRDWESMEVAEAAREAVEAYHETKKLFPSGSYQRLVERAAIEDEEIPAHQHHDLAMMLRRLAAQWNML